jgi:hypothetical protein
MLESELSIARAGGSYMVLDIPGKTISLKARGMVLKSWDIESSRVWGRRIPMKTLKLKLKSALKPPQRANITPGKEQDAPPKEASPAKTSSEPDLGILELKDMPVHYDLVFEDEIRVSVKPRGQKFGTRLTNLGKALGRAIGLPIKTFFRAVRKRPFTEISISLKSENDAREIYWAFLDGHNTIIIP